MLSREYHCLAEDLGYDDGDETKMTVNGDKVSESAYSRPRLQYRACVHPNIHPPTRTYSPTHPLIHSHPFAHLTPPIPQLCKIIEYSSCDLEGVGLRWKPWLDPDLLNESAVCRRRPTEMFWQVHGQWMATYHAAVRDAVL